ncbi:tetratricopeptide repeat protein [Neobacillus vireti]|nr:tetratricopeptide repeat protein [Neobacillus vireti]
MMRLREKTLEELEDWEEELNDREQESGHPNYATKIELFREMVRRFQQLVRQNKDDYSHELEYVKWKLIYSLIHYGTYLKTVYQKDDHLAAKCLEEALKYDRTNPIAAYRLGFLSYKKRNYSEAIQYFELTLTNHKYYEKHQYQLDDQQVIHAHIYLTNSALKIAKEAYEKMNQLPQSANQNIPIHEFSSLFLNLQENEQYLQRNAFYQLTGDEKTTCSKEECERLIDSEPSNTIILYFSDRNITAFFEGEDVSLSADQGIMLQYFLLKSSEDHPATRNAFSDVETIKQNTFVQKVNRLKNKLREKGLPPMIQTKRYQGETAYYFDGSCEFYIMYRVDDVESE